MNKTLSILKLSDKAFYRLVSITTILIYFPLSVRADDGVKMNNTPEEILQSVDSILSSSSIKLLLFVGTILLIIKICSMIANFLVRLILSSLKSLVRLATLLLVFMLIIAVYIDPTGTGVLIRSLILFLIQ